MTSPPEYFKADTPVREVASSFARDDFGAAPVCNAEGRLQGVITDRDIVMEVVAAGKDPNTVTAGDVAGRHEVVTIGADDSLEEAVETMKTHKVRRLPVIDGTTLVGMVSQADLARALDPAKAGELLAAVSSD